MRTFLGRHNFSCFPIQRKKEELPCTTAKRKQFNRWISKRVREREIASLASGPKGVVLCFSAAIRYANVVCTTNFDTDNAKCKLIDTFTTICNGIRQLEIFTVSQPGNKKEWEWEREICQRCRSFTLSLLNCFSLDVLSRGYSGFA